MTYAKYAKASAPSRKFVQSSPVDPKAIWYRPYADSRSQRNLLPHSLTSYSAPMMVSDLKEILYRIEFDVTWSPAQTSSELQKKTDTLPWKKNSCVPDHYRSLRSFVSERGFLSVIFLHARSQKPMKKMHFPCMP